MPSLNLAEAQQIIDGATKKLEEVGVPMCVAVVDPRGDLIAMIRQDGTPWRSTLICQGKAGASVSFARPSGEMQERADSPIIRGITLAEGGHMIFSLGGVPLIRDDAAVAACGVGGGTGQQDEDCARAAVAAVS